MKQLRFVLALLTAFTSIAVSAQVEGQDVSPTRSEMQPLHFDQPILADTLRISSIVPYSELQKSELPLLQSSYDHTSNYMLPIMPALKPYQLWDGTSVIVYGSNYLMLGLMDFQTSSLSLHQDFGRLQLSASATANKYWMPMQSTLYTQYGFGGTIGYDLSDAVSLHAFGYYYAHNPLSALHLTEAMPTFASATALARILVYVATSIPCRASGLPHPLSPHTSVWVSATRW